MTLKRRTRRIVSNRTEHLIKVEKSNATYKDLDLPQPQIKVIREIVSKAAMEQPNIVALLAGPGGTGKTMTAEIIAHSLGHDLYRVDLGLLVSKYIGETGKNLNALFDGAAEMNCVLLFDEADSLFGKRGDVKDSHDRFVNIEINQLLDKMEAYKGIAILSINLEDALDDAFRRRFNFIVEFQSRSRPSTVQRKKKRKDDDGT